MAASALNLDATETGKSTKCKHNACKHVYSWVGEYMLTSDVAIIADNRLSIAERLRLRWSIILFNNWLSLRKAKTQNTE